MALLLKLNDLRLPIQTIQKEAEEQYPKDDEDYKEIHDALDTLYSSLNNAIAVIEKHFADEKTVTKIEKDLRDKMKEDPIYEDLSKPQQEAILEAVIEDPEKNLLTEEDLKKHITEDLKSLGSMDLVTKAYTKNDIINLGDAVSDAGSSDLKKYDAGLDVLVDMVETPTGREDALAFGLKRMMTDTPSRLAYINEYYGITGPGIETEGDEENPDEELSDTEVDQTEPLVEEEAGEDKALETETSDEEALDEQPTG